VTDLTTTPPPASDDDAERPAQLVDRVRVEMARRRALSEAIRPPKRRPQTPKAITAARLPRR
jgi:hypothetical protein